MIGKIFCFFGIHTWINYTDMHGLAGQHNCKYCGKLRWKAIEWPRCPSRPKK